MNELLTRIEELKQTGRLIRSQWPSISTMTFTENCESLEDMEDAAAALNDSVCLLPQTGVHCLLLTYFNEGITISIIHEQKK
jgi:hypothetical protein